MPDKVDYFFVKPALLSAGALRALPIAIVAQNK
jgi:hypothetical protein